MEGEFVREDVPERILCAAIWVDDGKEHRFQPSNIATGIVFCGWRHHVCFVPLEIVFPEGSPVDEEQRAGRHQGFLTSRNRYVDRTEAAAVAVASGQCDPRVTWLSSEDLY